MSRLLPYFSALLIAFCFTSICVSAQSPHHELLSKAAVEDVLLNKQYELGLESADLLDAEISDHYFSTVGSVEHVYLKQRAHGFVIDNATANFNRLPSGKITSFNCNFVLRASDKFLETVPTLSPEDAIAKLAGFHGISLPSSLNKISGGEDGSSDYVFDGSGFSMHDVPVELKAYAIDKTNIRLTWELRIYELDQQNFWNAHVDAITGDILFEENLVLHCSFSEEDHQHGPSCGTEELSANPFFPMPSGGSVGRTAAANDYNVYAEPIESPYHGSRTIENAPWNLVASPFGWHDLDGVAGADTNITLGNNVHAYSDRDNTGGPTNPGDNPSGGSTNDFNFPVNLTYHPDSNHDAAVTNLFYWNNLIHDVIYHHGFDEASGNLQDMNFTGLGFGNDGVNAEAMDGGGTNNANMSTPPDGFPARMQMYLWTAGTPDRDGDFDNGIIAHEYGHSLSIRLTGGPGNTSCLGGNEQMGEGWSDWLGLILTIDTSMHDDSTGRGIGTFALNQPPSGAGIRPYRYTLDSLVSQYHYDHIKTFSVPHGVGSVWAAMVWDLTWNLILEYGYDGDIYAGTGGNNMAMDMIILAMKLQSCNPGFVDGRDAILEADEILNNGANKCLIWKTFARRGLGYSAYQGVPRLRGDGDEAFDLPACCENELIIEKTVDKEYVSAGGDLTFTITTTNQTGSTKTQINITDTLGSGTSASIGACGSFSSGVISYTIDTLFPGESHTCTFIVTLPTTPYTTELFADNMEYGTSSWLTPAGTGINTWAIDSLNPARGSKCWYGVGTSSTTIQNLEMANTVLVSASSKLRFKHQYNFEHEWDGGVVEISSDSGGTWTDLETHFEKNGYDTTLRSTGPLGATDAFTGASLEYITSIVDLSSFAGDRVIIRFRIATDGGAGSYGWYIDDVFISDEVVYRNTAHASSAEGDNISDSIECPTLVRDPALPVGLLSFQVESFEKHLGLFWKTSMERNNKGFYVTRRTASQNNFETIGFVEGNNLNVGGEYTFDDFNVEPNITYYYQLRQEDFDGTQSYSEIEKGKINGVNSQWKAQPNPLDNFVLISNAQFEGTYQLKVYDLHGKVLYEGSGSGITRLNTEAWASGMYIVEVAAGDELSQLKLNKR